MPKLSEIFKNKFVKVCTNKTRAYKIREIDGVPTKVPMLFRRIELTQWAKEALERGEDYIYHEPVNPLDPYGEQKLCKPNYEYVLKHKLTPDEFDTFARALESIDNQ